MEVEKKRAGGVPTGKAVDNTGGPIIDPTENVIALVKAEKERGDDLRRMATELHNAQILHAKEMANLREKHSEQVRSLDSDRLEKIRQVDQQTSNTTAERSQVAIQTLAATTNAEREALRNLVSTTAAAVAQANTIAMSSVTERIAALERSMYEGKGKSTVSDPMMVEMLAEIKALRTAENTDKGKQAVSDPMLVAMVAEMKALQVANNVTAGASTGKTQMWGYVAGAVGFLLTLISLAGAVIAFVARTPTTP